MDEAIKRKLAFKPCESKEDLHNWIKIFLGLDIPNSLVDPSSTCSPMDFIWEVYDRARNNNCDDFSRVMAYASRDSFKTLGASILEVLMICHLKRSVAHAAAIEAQATKAQQYVKKFFSKPILRDYIVGDNKRETWVIRYEHKITGDNLNQKEWSALPEQYKKDYEEVEHYIKILICSMSGMNSEHVPFMCVDELDLIDNKKAYEESKMIPGPRDGKMPITLLTSTRKSFGLVQKEIDDSNKTGLQIRHWNILDVTEKCPKERHRPELPKITIYRSDELLTSISEEQYNELTEENKKIYIKDKGWDGCLNNCRLFSMCQGRLVDCQSSKSSLLKPITDTINKFRHVSLDTAKAQLLCWKPSKEGLVYPRFNRQHHVISAKNIAEKITGDSYPNSVTKNQLINIFRKMDVKFYAGMDFGFTHDFAVVLAAVDNNIAFIFHCISMPQLELPQKIEICESQIKEFDPVIFPDMADPSSIKTFKKHGFRLRDWKKAPYSVMGGIETMRMKLSPTLGEPEIFLLAGDPGCELLAKVLSEYHFRTDSAGQITSEPNEENDDLADACRYLVMNVFGSKDSRFAMSMDTPKSDKPQQYTKENWFGQVMSEQLGRDYNPHEVEATENIDNIDKGTGKFCWSVD